MLLQFAALLAQAGAEDESINLMKVLLILAIIALIIFIFGGIARWRR